MNALTTPFLLILGLLATTCLADEDENEYREHDAGRPPAQKPHAGAATANSLYQTECGSCHLAYPPGLLPGDSWRKIMGQLDQHFGDNAELDTPVRQQITEYLLRNSAEQTDQRRARRIMRSLKGKALPMRITQLPYFKHEHGEIPSRLIKGNDKVRSLSNCNACHQRAAQGSFREREINIPGYGAWDD